jgi:hypothetical protein
MKLSIFVFTTLISCCLRAQGYRDHHFSVSYQPAYSFIDYFDPERLVLVSHQKINFGFTLGKHFSVSLTSQYSFGKKEGFYGGTPSNAPEGTSDATIKDVLGGIQVNYYRKSKQAFSPNGKYFGLGVEYGMSNSYREILVQSSDSWSYSYPYEFYDDEKRVPIIVVSFYTGRNFIIKERFLLGYGIQAGFVIGGGEGQLMRHFGKPFFNLGYIF